VSKYNLRISEGTEAFGCERREHPIVINNQITEQANSFNYLGCTIPYIDTTDVEINLYKFRQLFGTTRQMILRMQERMQSSLF
jgi:hypothetical protein